MSNIFKPKKKESEIAASDGSVPLENEQMPEKEIAPQTIEEIEEEESNQHNEEN